MMNRYKIELKTNLNKEIIVDAENEKEALEFVEKAFFKTNLLDFSNRDIVSVDAKIIEKNNEKIEENYEDDENPFEVIEELLEDAVEKIREEVPEENREFMCPKCGNSILIDDVIEEFMS